MQIFRFNVEYLSSDMQGIFHQLIIEALSAYSELCFGQTIPSTKACFIYLHSQGGFQ
jgi:hypothetical protein